MFSASPGRPLIVLIISLFSGFYLIRLKFQDINRNVLFSGRLGYRRWLGWMRRSFRSRASDGRAGNSVSRVDRSPSPEPIYSTDGKRLNTREYRTRRKLEEQRHQLVQRMHQINPDFKPPPDYKYDPNTIIFLSAESGLIQS